jgi:hypothetical protein
VQFGLVADQDQLERDDPLAGAGGSTNRRRSSWSASAPWRRRLTASISAMTSGHRP